MRTESNWPIIVKHKSFENLWLHKIDIIDKHGHINIWYIQIQIHISMSNNNQDKHTHTQIVDNNNEFENGFEAITTG